MRVACFGLLVLFCLVSPALAGPVDEFFKEFHASRVSKERRLDLIDQFIGAFDHDWTVSSRYYGNLEPFSLRQLKSVTSRKDLDAAVAGMAAVAKRKDYGEEVASAALKALGAINDEAAVTGLVELINDSALDDKSRAKAVEYLKIKMLRGSVSSAEQLLALSGNTRLPSSLRKAASETLRRVPELPLKPLQALARSDNPAIAKSAQDENDRLSKLDPRFKLEDVAILERYKREEIANIELRLK